MLYRYINIILIHTNSYTYVSTKHTAKRTSHGSNLYQFLFLFFIFISGGEEETMQNFHFLSESEKGRGASASEVGGRVAC
jgi:predicted neutral ceramidase superfamily lipid hydrolase